MRGLLERGILRASWPAHEWASQDVCKLYSEAVSDIFYFFCSGRGKGESEAPGGGGVDYLLRIPGGGGWGVRAGRVSAANWGIWGEGGAK